MRIISDISIKHNAVALGLTAFAAVALLFGINLCADNAAETALASRGGAIPTVIIDAGHGGIDGGTSAADGTHEKDINLSIAHKLNNFLTSFGINTVMVRTEDISIHDESSKTIRQKKVSDIKNRMKIIENTPNCIFVSIHQNHYGESKYSGTQVFYSKNNVLSEVLADSIQADVVSILQPANKRVIKPGGTDIYLLYHAQAPAVMVECGFLSNKAELENLKSDEYRNKLAFSICCGILDYISSSNSAA